MLVALGMILLVPSLSTFSMQQVQELSITLSLSGISLVLLLTTLLLGSSSIFRDVERRYVASVLTLPMQRYSYLLAKFISIAFFLVVAGTLLALCACVVIKLASMQYPSEFAIPWMTILLAIAGDVFKYILLASLALLFSAISTSFFLPFFGTVALYFCGSASQEVFEFVTGEFGKGMNPLSQTVIKAVYYVLPNFSAFDYKVHAIYALPVPYVPVLLTLLYAVLYTAIFFGLAIWAFNRRQFS